MTDSICSEASCYLGLTSDGMVKVCFPFDGVTNAQLLKIRPKGKFCGASKGWKFPLAAASQLKQIFGKKFFIQEDFSEWLHYLENPLPPLPIFKNCLINDLFLMNLVDGRKLFSHQISGAKWLLSRKRALLADEMGLGKTFTVLLAAKVITSFTKISVIVIAPVGLHQHWLNEAKFLGIKINLQSWAKIPKELPKEGTILIVDEAHFAQSINSKRTKSFLRLARHPRLRVIWMLTGTPMRNGHPFQLYPLLAAMKHPIADDKNLFEDYFCNRDALKTVNNFSNHYNYADNLKDLNILLQPYILNRKKKNLLSLPQKSRKKCPIYLSESEKIGFNYRLKLVIEDYRSRVTQGLVNLSSESLVALSAIRQISAEYKLSSVIRIIEQIGKEEPVIVFSNFLQPLYLLNDSSKGELLTGQQNIAERERVVSDFQLGKVNLLLTTYSVGGFGYTLHRARHVILLDRPWAPGDVEQAEDRCHRIGMKGPLISFWPELGFADTFVDSLLYSKEKNIKLVLGSNPIYLIRDSLPSMIHSLIMQLPEIN